MQTFEVEVKSLLGSEENAQILRERMKQVDSATTLTSRNKQLNHYFSSAEPQQIIAAVEQYFSGEHTEKLYDIFEKGKEFSIRTRDKDGKVLLVVKASVDNTTSSNGITRMEFEEEVPLTLDELDQVLLSAGCVYQAKWSREREEYLCRGVAVTLDKNAGYGWLAEFERVVKDERELEAARKEVRALMEQCGVQELQQDRLERMFAFYNAHWGEYYGTEKVFTIA
ncbi:MAG TPA: CYTH domain-containing protein [Candidatus Paceibacterota bacterium]|nr:CYTH domain-containing protein [Candidatus Paceibacterota bacterium]